MRQLRTLQALFLVLPLALSGCFRYLEVAPGDVRAGQEIRVQLTREAAQELNRDAGPFLSLSERGPELRGRIAFREPERLVVTPTLGSGASTLVVVGSPQVPVSFRQIAQLELRQLDGTRTALATVGAIGALAWLTFGILDLDTDPPTLSNPPPPEPLENRIPIIGRGRMGP